MGVSGIADDLVKGIKKFGKEVVEGAKDGPGKAARIKRGVNVVLSNGSNLDFEDKIKGDSKFVKNIINKGRKDFDSLSDNGKEIFKTFEKHADSAGEIKNYADIVAGEMDRIRKMSDDEIVKSGAKKYSTITGMQTFRNKPTGMTDEEWARKTRQNIAACIEPGEKTAGRIAGDFAGGGIYGSYNAYKNMADGKKSIIGAIKEGHSVINDAGEKVISGKRVAGTAVTAAGAASLGNRVFRDEYGELDVPVVPFI